MIRSQLGEGQVFRYHNSTLANCEEIRIVGGTKIVGHTYKHPTYGFIRVSNNYSLANSICMGEQVRLIEESNEWGKVSL